MKFSNNIPERITQYLNDIEDYGENTIEDCFDADWELSDQQKAEWGFDE